MSLIDKSEQRVGDNSSAIQVAGNATIGNSTSEVIEICKLVVMKELSSLREEAMDIAMQRAQEFAIKIANRLSSEVDDKIRTKLKDPDIEFSIREATLIVAKKGCKTKSDLLQEIIVSKVSNENEETDLLLDHALEITKRLTTSEIKLLALIYYIRIGDILINQKSTHELIENYKNGILHPSITLNECYSINKQKLSLTFPLLKKIIVELASITPVKLNHLELKGCLDSQRRFNHSILEFISKKTGLTIDSTEQFEECFPDIKEIISAFGIESLSKFDVIVPNELGVIIAKSFMQAQGVYETIKMSNKI